MLAKEQQRAEMHRTIWAIANDLRGNVDGWDFKQYVLGFLFYRYMVNVRRRAACDENLNVTLQRAF